MTISQIQGWVAIAFTASAFLYGAAQVAAAIDNKADKYTIAVVLTKIEFMQQDIKEIKSALKDKK
jgi:hypothetical protein